MPLLYPEEQFDNEVQYHEEAIKKIVKAVKVLQDIQQKVDGELPCVNPDGSIHAGQEALDECDDTILDLMKTAVYMYEDILQDQEDRNYKALMPHKWYVESVDPIVCKFRHLEMKVIFDTLWENDDWGHPPAKGEEGADKNCKPCKEYVDYIESLAEDDQKTVWEDYGQFDWEEKGEDPWEDLRKAKTKAHKAIEDIDEDDEKQRIKADFERVAKDIIREKGFSGMLESGAIKVSFNP